ncbi:MAG: hypothetical protein IPL28_12960 [Chloroflexi bacterium]|nr:hypothetical protein [Chloroflexota bacterium]
MATTADGDYCLGKGHARRARDAQRPKRPAMLHKTNGNDSKYMALARSPSHNNADSQTKPDEHESRD